MDKTYQEKIQEIVSQALADKTFTPEVLAQISEVYKEHEQALKDIEQKNTTIENLREERQVLSFKNDEYVKQLEAYKSREEEITRKEKEQREADLEIRHANQRVQDIKEIIGIVFKNPVFQESTYKSEPDMRPGSYNGQTVQTSETTKKEVVTQ